MLCCTSSSCLRRRLQFAVQSKSAAVVLEQQLHTSCGRTVPSAGKRRGRVFVCCVVCRTGSWRFVPTKLMAHARIAPRTSFFVLRSRSPICTRRTAATQRIRGCHTQRTTVTRMRRTRMPPRRTRTTTTWRSTAACCGYRSTTATVPGAHHFGHSMDWRKINAIRFFFVCLLVRLVIHRLHHDQQTAHALESAAAYSSYPSMAGK